jgi:hypothetical protein
MGGTTMASHTREIIDKYKLVKEPHGFVNVIVNDSPYKQYLVEKEKLKILPEDWRYPGDIMLEVSINMARGMEVTIHDPKLGRE